MAQKFSNGYENKWTISMPDFPTEFKNIVTPSFTPLPGNNITFCFKAWYQVIGKYAFSLFKLKLVKLSGVCISPTFVVNVKVYYSNGNPFMDYPNQILNDNSSYLTFEDVVRNYAGKRDSGILTLTIRCKMTIYDQDQTSFRNQISLFKLPTTTNKKKSPTKEIKSSKYVDFIKNLKSIYEPSTLSDLIFKVGDKSFPAHKVILSAHSPVFKNMMTHEFLESKTNSVTITDATPEIFDLFLRYLYSGELENKSWDSLKQLYYLADKYDVGFLKIECTEAAISILSVDLVCEILKLSYGYSDSDLKIAAIKFAVNHIKEIVPREDWKELVSVHPIIGYEVTVNFIPK